MADVAPPIHVEVAGQGPPTLVLLHGFTQTGRSWAPITARLGPAPRIVAVDAPGHGDSAAAVTDLRSGAASIVAAAGAGIYVGYSMGARYALCAALARPDAVERLVLLGVNPGIEDADERAARRAADDALADSLEADGVDAFLDRWLALPLFASLSPDAADPADRRRNTAAGLASSLRHAGTGAQDDLWPRLGELSMPVLVVAGDRDTKFRAIAERAADAIGANASFALVPDAGHAAHLEQPDAFVGLLRAFVRL